MASISFPTNPTNGDTYTYNGVTYEFNSAKSQWIIQVGTSLADVNINSIGGSMIPSANVTHDLGTSDKAFRDLYLSGSSINLGGATISSSGSAVTLPAGSTVGGVTIGTGSGGATQYANASLLPTSGLTAGEFAFVGNTLFMTNGTGWYSVALINQTPELTLSTSSITLGNSGNTINFTFTATDPDGPTPTVTATTTANNSQANVTVYSSNSTVTVENLSANNYSANITVTASDGINQTFGTVTLVVSYVSEFWDETVLSIGTSSTNSLNNSTFIDRSTNALTVTPAGNPYQTAFHPYLDNWSVDFDQYGHYLSAGTTILNHLATGTSTGASATIEAWVNPRTYGTGASAWMFSSVFSKGNVYTNFGVYNGKLRFYWYNGAALFVESTSVTDIPLNKWTHIAATINESTINLYINGILNTTSQTFTGIDVGGLNGAVLIGREPGGGQEFDGFISDLRVSDQVLYSSTFAPPTEKLTAESGTLLLTCQSNRFIDNSSSANTITTNGNPKISAFNPLGQGSEYAVGENKGSVYLNGSSYMTLATSPFHMDQSDFTAECWIYPTVLGRYIMGIWSSTSASNQSWSFRTFSGGNINSEIDPGDVQIATSSAGIIKLNQWHHVALTRSGGDFRIFVNGDVVASGSSPGFNMAEGGGFMGIGAVQGLTGSPFTGYISDVYIRKGAAKYTSAFTIPTAPVQNTNATLYLPFDNVGIFDKTGNRNLNLVGNASTSTTQTKYADTAIYFDGTGDYIVSKNHESLILGTSDFTIETWIYTNTLPSTGVYWVFIDNRAQSSAGDTNRFTITFKGSTIVYFSKGADRITSSAISTNQWYHFALCRSGSTTKMFINGSQAGSNYTDTTNYNNTENRPIIGGDGDGVLSNFNGYFENFQIIKGVAKYTTNFTPPNSTQGRVYQAES